MKRIMKEKEKKNINIYDIYVIKRKDILFIGNFKFQIN